MEENDVEVVALLHNLDDVLGCGQGEVGPVPRTGAGWRDPAQPVNTVEERATQVVERRRNRPARPDEHRDVWCAGQREHGKRVVTEPTRAQRDEEYRDRNGQGQH